jgi:hypothetical protein
MRALALGAFFFFARHNSGDNTINRIVRRVTWCCRRGKNGVGFRKGGGVPRTATAPMHVRRTEARPAAAAHPPPARIRGETIRKTRRTCLTRAAVSSRHSSADAPSVWEAGRDLLEGKGEAVTEGGELGLESHPARQPRLHLPWGGNAGMAMRFISHAFPHSLRRASCGRDGG